MNSLLTGIDRYSLPAQPFQKPHDSPGRVCPRRHNRHAKTPRKQYAGFPSTIYVCFLLIFVQWTLKCAKNSKNSLAPAHSHQPVALLLADRPDLRISILRAGWLARRRVPCRAIMSTSLRGGRLQDERLIRRREGDDDDYIIESKEVC